MKEKEIDFYNAYKVLGIEVEPIEKNYTPERYGKKLMASSRNCKQVSYSNETIIPIKQDEMK